MSDLYKVVWADGYWEESQTPNYESLYSVSDHGILALALERWHQRGYALVCFSEEPVSANSYRKRPIAILKRIDWKDDK